MIYAESQFAIECENLWKVFGTTPSNFKREYNNTAPEFRVQMKLPDSWVGAVKNATFNINTGEVFVIMGLSGSGKSTLVRCLSRLIEPTAGKLRIQGTDLLAANDRELRDIRRKTMSMVFQHFALLPNRDVLGNVAFPLQVQGVKRAQREIRAREMIELVGLSAKVNQYPRELSGGQQQRVGIARSLATDPAIWFLDEPFSALDPLIRADLQDELLRLQAQLNKTVVFITHDLDEAIRIADRIAIMDQGEIVQIGTPEELVLHPANDYVARFTQSVPLGKVTSVSTIMTPAGIDVNAPPADALRVREETKVDEIAKAIAGNRQLVLVEDAAGKILGKVESGKVFEVLSGVFR